MAKQMGAPSSGKAQIELTRLQRLADQAAINSVADLRVEAMKPQGDVKTADLAQAAAAAKAPNWECGVLVLPAKVELGGKEEVLAAPTGALYFGRRLGWEGEGSTLRDIFGDATYIIGFVGYTSNFTNTKTASGSTSTTSNTGITYGGGFSFGIHQNDARIGVVVGFDHVATSNGYAYNDKPWISLALGSNF